MGASFIDEIIGRLDIDIEGALEDLDDVITKLLDLREVIEESNQVIDLLDKNLNSLKSSTQIDLTEYREFDQQLDNLENQVKSLSHSISEIGSTTPDISVTNQAIETFEKVINQLEGKVAEFRNEQSNIKM